VRICDCRVRQFITLGLCVDLSVTDARIVQVYCQYQLAVSVKAVLAEVTNNKTSSSAVKKRPRGASCLSVVSFNSTKRRVESFIVSYVGYRFVTAFS